jgi:hypothetical protein
MERVNYYKENPWVQRNWQIGAGNFGIATVHEYVHQNGKDTVKANFALLLNAPAMYEHILSGGGEPRADERLTNLLKKLWMDGKIPAEDDEWIGGLINGAAKVTGTYGTATSLLLDKINRDAGLSGVPPVPSDPYPF